MSEEDTPMDDDALVDGWDAHVSGRANGLDRLHRHDREVIEMLYIRTWSPSPGQSFASDLRSRLTAGSTPDQVAAPVAPRPVHRLPFSGARPVPWRTWQRVALATVLIVALLSSIDGRFADDPPASTVLAPVALATPLSETSTASPTAEGTCPVPDVNFAHLAGLVIDTATLPRIEEAFTTARYVTIQYLEATSAGSVLAPSALSSGVTGIAVDIVVVGSAEASLTGEGWVHEINDIQSNDARPIGAFQSVELLRGDSIVYPIGSFNTLSNRIGDRPLQIVRVVFHDFPELVSGELGDSVDSVALRTLASGAIPDDFVAGAAAGIVLLLEHTFALPDREPPPAVCRADDGSLAVSGPVLWAGESPSSAPRYLVFLDPFAHPAP